MPLLIKSMDDSNRIMRLTISRIWRIIIAFMADVFLGEYFRFATPFSDRSEQHRYFPIRYPALILFFQVYRLYDRYTQRQKCLRGS